jgi:hypothetical protein
MNFSIKYSEKGIVDGVERWRYRKGAEEMAY